MNRQLAGRALIILALSVAAAACGATEPSTLSSPTASVPPVQAPPNPRLVEFEGRVADGITREGQLVRALSAASVGARGHLGLVARQMNEWAAEELAWLDEHPADACYREAADAYGAGLTDIAAAATAFAELAAASDPPSDEEGQAAGRTLSTGTESIQEAAALATSARAACR